MTTVVQQKPRKLNRPLLEREESAWVDQRIPWQGDVEELFMASARIVAQAEVAASKERPKRDAAVLSLSFYDGVRALHDVIGVSRNYFHTMRTKALRLTDEEKKSQWLANASREQIAARAAECGVKRIDTAKAIRDAEKFGDRVFRYEQRATSARVTRDPAIVDLYRLRKWPRGRIADIAELDESRISQIVGDADPATTQADSASIVAV